MKKRVLTSIVAVAATFTTMTAYASSGVVMFGDTPQRTHVNNIMDQYPWTAEAILNSASGSGISLSGSQMNSSSTAIGAGKIMYYPVSAGKASNNFQGTGYMIAYDMGKWIGGKPLAIGINEIPNASNSSPVYDPTNQNAYLAAGTKLYRFNVAGNTLTNTSVSIGGTGNLNGGQNYNQVVSYPLYVTASELGVPTDSIWVGTQNGYIYVIDPSTMSIIHYIHLGVRFDASLSLVKATNGAPYIAVTGAFDANNANYGGHAGTGMLFLINPKKWSFQYLANPYGAIPSVASPVGISQGHVMWNDTQGDVFLGTVNPNGTVSMTRQWHNIGNGQTSYLSESGYANGQYIVPFTDKGTYGYATVDPKVSSNQVERYSVSGGSGTLEPIGSPEISASGNMYLADQMGGIDRISPNPSNGNLYDGKYGGWLASFGTSSGTPLSTPSELMLNTASGVAVPTLTLATSQGLELWDDVGANYSFGADYTSTQPSQFTTPLALILGANDLPAGGGSDQIAFSMSVNGGPFHYVTESPVYRGNTPQSQITLSTSLLNGTFAPWKQFGWLSGQTNTVTIRAYAPSSDQYGYTFSSTDSGQNQSSATVRVTFPADHSMPPQNLCPPGSNGCIDSLPNYVIMRTIAPGSSDKEGALAGYPPSVMPQHHVHQDTPIAESTNGSHSGVYSIGITDGYPSQLPITFTLKAELQTVIDQKYNYTYVSGYSPKYGCMAHDASGNCTQTGIVSYTPQYKTITLYCNLPVTETAEQTFTMSNGETELWNPWNVTATIQGGNPSTMSLHGFAPFGAWVAPQHAFPSGHHAEYSQGGNLNGYLNYTGGNYPLNASYGQSSTTQSAPYDALHNDGILVEPNKGYGDNPGAVGWAPQLQITALSGQQYFSHPEIYDYMQTWNAGIFGTNQGQLVWTGSTGSWSWSSSKN